MNKIDKALDVRRFTDYRAFLLAHFRAKKLSEPGWSYGRWAKQLGFKSTSTLTKILQGKREAGDEVVERMVVYFCFNSRRAQYFRDLVKLHKIKKDPHLSLLLLEKMSRSFADESSRTLDEETFSLISKWYCVAIREMVRLDRFFDDPGWIADQLHFEVSQQDISETISALIKVGLLERGKDKCLKIVTGRFKTSDDIPNEAIKKYHEESLDNAKKAVRKIDVSEREFTASTFVMKNTNLMPAKEYVRMLSDKVIKNFEEQGGDRVFQIQVQFFPLTRVLKRKHADQKGELC